MDSYCALVYLLPQPDEPAGSCGLLGPITILSECAESEWEYLLVTTIGARHRACRWRASSFPLSYRIFIKKTHYGENWECLPSTAYYRRRINWLTATKKALLSEHRYAPKVR